MAEIIRYPTRIIRVEERWTQVYKSGTGDKTVFDNVSTGWWITYDLGISMPCGSAKPDFRPGDSVRLTVEKIP